MNTKKLTFTALFIALSYIGANLKVMGSIAFDSMPGFLGTLVLGPIYGALIGAVGHLLTAALSGFPLTLPVHLIVMVDMALTMAAFGIVYRKFKKKAAVVLSFVTAVLINGPVSLLMVSPLLIPVMGKDAVLAMLPVLAGVAAINVLLAFIVYKVIPKSFLQAGERDIT